MVYIGAWVVFPCGILPPEIIIHIIMASLPEPDQTIDLTGLKCPLPVLRTKKALALLPAGRVLRVIASDPGALADIPAFARLSGHELLAAEPTDCGSVFLLRR